MHVADLERNILGANGIVGAAMPLSVGAALAVRLRGGDQVVVAFFGDGANNQGIFHELLNLAAVWKLPVLFVCENNHYALSTSYRQTTSVDNVAQRAVAYGIPGCTVDGNDVIAVHAAIGEAVARARAGEGPSLVECDDLALGPAQHARQSARPAQRGGHERLDGARPDRAAARDAGGAGDRAGDRARRDRRQGGERAGGGGRLRRRQPRARGGRAGCRGLRAARRARGADRAW